jgi:hypothetical protein
LTPGSGNRDGLKNQGPERTTHIIWNNFLDSNIFNFLMRTRDPELEKVGSGILDKHPRSATLIK